MKRKRKRSVVSSDTVAIVVGLSILAVVVGLIGLLMVRMAGNWVGKSRDTATEEARAWAGRLGVPAAAVECARMDTDGDGYVGCAVMSEGKPLMIECAGWLTINEGCRLPKAMVVR